MKRRLGFFGGSFDPPHIGHLAVADAALRELKLDQLIFIPNSQPPHKSRPDMASAEHRLQMLKRAIGHHPSYAICDLELRRSGPSFTVDTVRILCEKHSSLPRPFFIVGDDAAATLPRWKGIEELCRLVDFVSLPRHGSLAPTPELKIRELEMPVCAVSSTQLRDDLRQGALLRGRIPAAVLSYIDEHRLYAASTMQAQAA